MANFKNTKQTYDEKERLIWGLVLYAGLIKQSDMPKLGIPSNTAGNWKKRYHHELNLIDGIITILLTPPIE